MHSNGSSSRRPARLLARVGGGILLCGLLAGRGAAQGAVPAGAQFQVNTYTTGYQGDLAVAADAEGDFVVVWVSAEAPGPYTYRLQGRRYASDGTALGGEFRIDGDTTDYLYGPAVAADGDGDFIVVWNADDTIQGRRYASGGAALGDQFQIDGEPEAYSYDPALAAAANGSFVVVWQSYGAPGSDPDFSIQGRRFSSGGAALGSQFQVNAYTTGSQQDPDVAAAADGSFVVIWGGPSESDTGGGVLGRRFASDGAALGGELQVNTYTTGFQGGAEVAADPDGNFVVVWDGPSGSDAVRGILGRRYASGGATLGDEFQVNTYTTSDQRSSAVAVDADGDFVVTWQSLGSAGSDTDSVSVQARRFSSAGAALGSQFQVNTYTTAEQVAPVLAAASSGDFVVAWESYGSVGDDSDNYSIQGQRFLAPEPSGGWLAAVALAGVAAAARARARASRASPVRR